VGTQVTLDGSASSDVEGSSLTYAWDFGDGEKGTGATPTHVYAAAGDFFVTLVVNDGTFDSPTTAGTHSFALVAVTDTSDGGVADGGVQDGGVVLDAPPDMPAASTSGCGCTTSDVTLALWLAAGWLLSTRRRR
jgi:MYXO-CTERM domain-containing protein